MFSTLPKLFDRAFLLGFFLPALLFAVAAVALCTDASLIKLIPDLESSEGAKSLTGASLALLSAWVLALLLMTMNYFLYRLLEGYLWPFSRIGWLKRQQLKKFAAFDKKLKRLKAQWLEDGDAFPQTCKDSYSQTLRTRRAQFPFSEDNVLATKFGNAIRAFEGFPYETYGVDTVSVWLRLLTVVPKDFREQIADARSQVDFFVNICALSVILAVIGLAQLLCHIQLASLLSYDALRSVLPPNTRSALAVIISVVISRASYRFATMEVGQWGDLVKSAFDCYLPSLAKQLGYDLPTKGQARRKFWSEVNGMLLYGEPLSPEDWFPIASDGRRSPR
jgi:hypothetical protein